MESLKSRLKKGETIELSNEIFQQRISDDDIRFATLNHSERLGFVIVFNGALVHTSITFKSFENKLNKLITKWHLEWID